MFVILNNREKRDNMSELKEMIIDNTKVVFVNRSENTNYGFRHISEMFINGGFASKGARQYYNRTWEKYRFQSVMKTTVYKLINEKQEYLKDCYKSDNNILRMTKKHKDTLEETFMKNNYLMFLNKVMENLN